MWLNHRGDSSRPGGYRDNSIQHHLPCNQFRQHPQICHAPGWDQRKSLTVKGGTDRGCDPPLDPALATQKTKGVYLDKQEVNAHDVSSEADGGRLCAANFASLRKRITRRLFSPCWRGSRRQSDQWPIIQAISLCRLPPLSLLMYRIPSRGGAIAHVTQTLYFAAATGVD